jgi:hypothetical protein
VVVVAVVLVVVVVIVAVAVVVVVEVGVGVETLFESISSFTSLVLNPLLNLLYPFLSFLVAI